MADYFVINEVLELYRWIGLRLTDEDVAMKLARTKFAPVKDSVGVLRVEWLSETSDRNVCDFPNFHSQFTCMSARAAACLSSLIQDAGEFIELVGLDLPYSAFHCLTVYDALDRDAFDKMQAQDRHLSIAGPATIPPLVSSRIGGGHIFHIPEVRNKFFVSDAFLSVYRQHQLTGLSFHKVPVR